MDEICKVQHALIAMQARNTAFFLRNSFGFEKMAQQLDAFSNWHMEADKNHASGITHGSAPKEEEL